MQTVHDEAPCRPRPSPELLEFFPLLANYVARMDWDERRNHELATAQRNAERALSSARDEVADMEANLRNKDQQMQGLRERQANHVQILERKLEEQRVDFNEKLDASKKREQTIDTNEARLKRTPTIDSPDQEVFDSIKEEGALITTAI